MIFGQEIEIISLITGIVVGFTGMLLFWIFWKTKPKFNLSILTKLMANTEVNLKQAYDNVEQLAGFIKEAENA